MNGEDVNKTESRLEGGGILHPSSRAIAIGRIYYCTITDA